MFFIGVAVALVIFALAFLLFVRRGAVPATIALAALIVWTAANSVTVVDNANVAVGRSFGQTYKSSYAPGIHLVAPWVELTDYNRLRQEFTYDGTVVTNDTNPLQVTVGFAVTLNPDLAWKIQEKVGENYFASLVEPAGQTAARNGISGFGWVAAATTSRTKVEEAILAHFRAILTEQLVSSGVDAGDAKIAINVLPVQLRQSLPDRKVLNAVAERTAASQDLERQKILTDIATEEALRRTQEGMGVSKLFSQLPKGFTADEISGVLGALATKTRADAMLKAVESGQVDTMILNGDASGSFTASTDPVSRANPDAVQAK